MKAVERGLNIQLGQAGVKTEAQLGEEQLDAAKRLRTLLSTNKYVSCVLWMDGYICYLQGHFRSFLVCVRVCVCMFFTRYLQRTPIFGSTRLKKILRLSFERG